LEKRSDDLVLRSAITNKPPPFHSSLRSSPPLPRRLLSQFAQRNEENGGYLFTKQLKDKLVVHMLILFMVACGGKEVKCATFGTLLRNLKMETKVAGDFLRMAGVNVKKASDGGVAAELKVPLTFHSGVKRGRGKG